LSTTKITPFKLSENERVFLEAISRNGRIIDGLRFMMEQNGFIDDEKKLAKVIKKIKMERLND
jgi:hypothetical protein